MLGKEVLKENPRSSSTLYHACERILEGEQDLLQLVMYSDRTSVHRYRKSLDNHEWVGSW